MTDTLDHSRSVAKRGTKRNRFVSGSSVCCLASGPKRDGPTVVGRGRASMAHQWRVEPTSAAGENQLSDDRSGTDIIDRKTRRAAL
ncbi:MAG: hypothetical protein ACOVKS_15630 [Aquimonas sp.]